MRHTQPADEGTAWAAETVLVDTEEESQELAELQAKDLLGNVFVLVCVLDAECMVVVH